MRRVEYLGRKAYQWENEQLRVTVLAGGGHVAEAVLKSKGVNPLWTPPWPTIDPSTYDVARHPEYGDGPEAKVLSGITGHNLCLDLFGPPSEEEFAAGYATHGEASVVDWGEDLRVHLPMAQLNVKRTIELDGASVKFSEEVENLLPFDRHIAWQEHVTLGPPFVERGVTELDALVMRSARENGDEFEWTDKRYPVAPVNADYHAHLLGRGEVKVRNRNLGLEIGYEWNLQDFPWLGIWEQSCERTMPPWNGETVTWGVEFGASPFAELRFRRATRGMMWLAPTAVWLPARSVRRIEYVMSLSEC